MVNRLSDPESRRWLGRLARAGLAAAFLGAGAAGGVLWSERRAATTGPIAPAGSSPDLPPAPPAGYAPRAPAGLTATTTTDPIVPNAYRDTRVSALVGGRPSHARSRLRVP